MPNRRIPNPFATTAQIVHALITACCFVLLIVYSGTTSLAELQADSSHQLAIWTFDGAQSFASGVSIAPTIESVNGSPILILMDADIVKDGVPGAAYTDIDSNTHSATLAAAWSDIKKNSSPDAEFRVRLDTSGWQDISIRFDYKSASSTAYNLSYSTDDGASWPDLLDQDALTADASLSAWTAETIDLTSISAVENQSNLWIRFNNLDVTGNDEFYFDNFEITGIKEVVSPNAPTIRVDSSTTDFLNLSTTGNGYLSAVIDDPTDPIRTLGVKFVLTNMTDGDLPPTISSSNTAVVADQNWTWEKSGALYSLRINPTGVGYTDIAITASNGSGQETYTIQMAVSAAPAANSGGRPDLARFHTGMSDASSAIAVDADFMLVVNDELIGGKDGVYLINREKSGKYVKLFDFTTSLGLTKEADLEASTRVGETIYWIGSHSNNKDGECRNDRNRLFETTVAGSGSNTTLAFVGRYDHLRADLIAWDNSPAIGKYYGFEDSAKCANSGGLAPKNPDGFNIEGLALAPGSDTIGFIGFRAPISPANDRTKALILPLNNMTALLSLDGGSAGSAEFGTPIELDLDGRGIRSIERNADNEYLIIAGSWGGENDDPTHDFQLYTWTGKDPSVSGNAGDEPKLLDISLPDVRADGSWESIVELPTPLAGSQVQLLVDNGTTKWYADGKESKDLTPNWQKFRSEWVTIPGESNAPTAITVLNNNDGGADSLRKAIADVANGGMISFAGNLSGQTISLASTLTIAKDLTIDGSAAPGLIISGNNAVRVFTLESGTLATLQGLTIQDGFNSDWGGGILNSGTLNIVDSVLANNQSDHSGGAIANQGALSINRSGIYNNSAALWAGGLENSVGVASIFNSTFSGNHADGNNEDDDGGGAINQYGESATMTISFSTITDNRAPNVTGRDGIWLQGGKLDIRHSIVAANNSSNCTIDQGALFSATGENIDDQSSCTGFSKPNTKPQLTPLADNGGPTPTYALQSGSPAINAIADNTCDGTKTDQRGIARPQGAGCDIGAFEFEGTTEMPPTTLYLPTILKTAKPVVLVPMQSTWRYLDTGSDQGNAWRMPVFDDSGWRSGQAELGYGDTQVTEVQSGPADNKYITTYFRREFIVADPASFQALRLQLLRDDGAVVYLNGVEVMRTNMPEGTILFDTRAVSAIGGDAESTIHYQTIPANRLVLGSNSLAVEIHQISPTSSDISFDLGLIGQPVSAPTELIANGSTWTYLDNGSDQGTAWSTTGFDDSGWRSGQAELGYGDTQVTEVESGPATDRYITTYFRREFIVSDAASFRGLDLQLQRDDGAVVYLNGVELMRSNMPEGTIRFDTRAVAAVGGADESRFYHTALFTNQLVTGVNVLAVEIHQANPTSSDISFDLNLRAIPKNGAARFAAIGDFGDDTTAEGAVADRVKNWNPDFVITLGDNNYDRGEASTIDGNIGKYYSDFIFPYTGAYGSTAAENRFFPSLGNHDWETNSGSPPVPQPYLDYFTLPGGQGNERYYEFVRGPVHFFVIDSDPREPDGTSATSTQATWLKQKLSAASEPWKVVYMHHPPYSSARHGSQKGMQWPYTEWGASVVMAGHDHVYERFWQKGIPYYLNGAGGRGLYEFKTVEEGSLLQHRGFGAMLIQATSCSMLIQFMSPDGGVIDSAQFYSDAGC